MQEDYEDQHAAYGKKMVKRLGRLRQSYSADVKTVDFIFGHVAIIGDHDF